MNIVRFDFSHDSICKRKDRILQRFSDEFAGANEHYYLLVDPTLMELNNDDDIWHEILQREYSRIDFNHNELSGSLFLWLVELDLAKKDDYDLLECSVTTALTELEPQSLGAGSGRAICGWIITPVEINYLAKYIEKIAIQHVSGTGNILFRFFDPSVLNVSENILNTWQYQRMLGGVRRWYCLDGDGELRGHNGGYDGNRLMCFSLSLDENIYRNIKNIGRVNGTLRYYRYQLRGNARISEQDVHGWLLTAFSEMSEMSFLESKSDCAIFGFHVLTEHPFFYRNEILRRKLSLIQPGDYQDLIDETDRDYWREIISICHDKEPFSLPR